MHRCLRLTGATGFEPAISGLTGRHVKPLHHAPYLCAKSNIARHATVKWRRPQLDQRNVAKAGIADLHLQNHLADSVSLEQRII